MFSLASTDYADLHRLKKRRVRESAKICGPTIWEQQSQNRAQVFAPEWKIRCRSPAQTRMRSRNRHRGLVRVEFLNLRQLVLWRGCSPSPRAKLPSKNRATRAHSFLPRQKFAARAANCSSHQRAASDQPGTARTELPPQFSDAAKTHARGRFARRATTRVARR